MYERIFGKYPQVKVINYVLINPDRKYSKKEIAYGAKISRVTLDSFIQELVNLEILVKDGLSYYVNISSDIVKTLIKTQITLAELIMNNELEKSGDVIENALSDEEFEKFMDTFDYEVDIDKELKTIEDNEEILVNKKEYEQLKDVNHRIFSSESISTDIIMTQYINKDFDNGMINYG